MSIADELKKLADLHESGAINQAEFDRAKASLFGQEREIEAAPERGMGLIAKSALIVVGLGASLLAYGFYVESTPLGKERATARAAIDLCWKQYGIKSHDDGTKRFVAGACEQMESSFEKLYGRKP